MVAVSTVYKLQYIVLMFAVLLSKLSSVSMTFMTFSRICRSENTSSLHNLPRRKPARSCLIWLSNVSLNLSSRMLVVQRLSRKIWQNISLCGEMTKLGTLALDPCMNTFSIRTLKRPLVAAILNFNMAAIFDIPLPITLKLRQIKM